MAITVFPVDAVSGAPQYTGEMLRQALSALAGLAPSGRPLGATSGVRPGTPTNTVTSSSSTWTVKPHAGILDLETSATAGPYLYAVGANVTGSVTPADATNPRIDIVYMQLSDPAESDGSSTPSVQALYLAGTPAATPSAPATPARSLVLAQISVPASGGGSPSVTWKATGWNDTGWISGAGGTGQTVQGTGATGGYITTFALRLIGSEVTFYAEYTAGPAITVNTSGDIANTAVLQINDSRFIPSASAPVQGLGSAGVGRVAAHSVKSDGKVYLNAVAGSANIAAGDSFSVSGQYLIG